MPFRIVHWMKGLDSMESPQQKKNVFLEKYELYGSMLYRLSMVYLNNHMDCEDVLQEVFIKLLYNAPNFDCEEYERRWLLRICINCCKDKLKEKWRKDKLTLNENIYSLRTKEDYHLTETILCLPNKIKAPIHLYYFEGYKVNEISQILEISSSAVKMRLKRGRDLLKLELEENGY